MKVPFATDENFCLLSAVNWRVQKSPWSQIVSLFQQPISGVNS
jgi:hypothetical protein